MDDTKRALHIYGPDTESLKGKMTRVRPRKIMDTQRYEIPTTIKELHQKIHLSADYFFVQGMEFLHSISRGYTFRTIEHHADYKTKYNKLDILQGVKKCVNIYHSRGLEVIQLNTDNEFACIEEGIRPIKLNMVAVGEHAGDIERSGRTVKECTRCHVHRNPYERYTMLMVTGCVVKAIKDLNQRPDLDGISDAISPDTMITGRSIPNFNEITKLKFGNYVQVYRIKGATNTNKARCVGVIALYQLGNEQGGGCLCHYCQEKEYTVTSGRFYQWVEM